MTVILSDLTCVTGFDEILPLFGQIFEGEFSIWQKLSYFGKNVCDLANFQSFKWPNILR